MLRGFILIFFGFAVLLLGFYIAERGRRFAATQRGSLDQRKEGNPYRTFSLIIKLIGAIEVACGLWSIFSDLLS